MTAAVSTRRAVLLAAAGASAGSAAVQADPGLAQQGANTMNMQTSIRTRSADQTLWRKLQARLAAAATIVEQRGAEVDDAEARAAAARPRLEALDFREFPFENREYVARYLDLDARWQEWLALEGKMWWSKNRDAAIARVKAAHDSIREFRRKEIEAEEQARLPQAYDRLDRAIDARDEAEEAAIFAPSPDAAAVLWKITYARKRWEAFEDWPESWWSAVTADLERLSA